MNIYNTKFLDSILNFIEKYYYIFLIIILMIASLNMFYNLGKTPINSWDEARHGVNAYEMIKRNNYIVNTYGYENDYWNLKPPISYWAIVGGYKLVGFNSLGLRIFSAVASFITVLIVAIFTLHKHGRLASLISTFAITTSMPFVLEHCGRTGDADAIFVLFFTMSMVAMALIEENTNWLYAAGVSFAMAFLTKSWHAGNIVVIGIIYLILSKTLFKLKVRQIFMFILSCSFPILIWGFFRYKQDGLVFFETMINYDLLARSSTTLEGHVGSISFYIEALQRTYFYWLLVWVSIILVSTLFIKPNLINRRRINYVLAITLWIAVPFLLYTKAKTKIDWYILPIYPALAISIGAISSLLLRAKNRNFLFQSLLALMILLAIYKNEVSIIRSISNPLPSYAQVAMEEMKDLPEYRGKNIYTTFKTGSADNPNRWDQSCLLCAELYGDLIPVEGGINGFLKDNTDKPLLLIPKDKVKLLNMKVNSQKVVAESNIVYILTK